LIYNDPPQDPPLNINPKFQAPNSKFIFVEKKGGTGGGSVMQSTHPLSRGNIMILGGDQIPGPVCLPAVRHGARSSTCPG